MILNEPEASLHPDLLGPLARLLVTASQRCQLIVVSHAERLVEALERAPEVRVIGLRKDLGETMLVQAETPTWVWPSR
jgi:predicted ATPase